MGFVVLPAAREAACCWGTTQWTGGLTRTEWGWRAGRLMRETSVPSFCLGIWLLQALRVVGWRVRFKELVVFRLPW